MYIGGHQQDVYFNYGKRTAKRRIWLLAIVVGLSFFRVAGFLPAGGEENRYICEDNVSKLTDLRSNNVRGGYT